MKSFPLKKTRNPHGTLKTQVTPLHVLRNTRVPRNPWSRLYFCTHGNPFWRAQIQLHI